MENEKQLRWSNIALIAFVAVWGLGNVVNNFALQGLSVVTSWILIMIIYFIPYTLIVGQLGSTFKDAEGAFRHGFVRLVPNGSRTMPPGLIGSFIFHIWHKSPKAS
ncbi:amino acid transport protein [Lactiplantibacillus plantarum]|nr:amino acid transport protein [Lactiplantibacillus plantarum]